jgi:hypothetical protein
MMTTTTPTSMIAVPMSCAVLCTQLAELAQRIDDESRFPATGRAT